MIVWSNMEVLAKKHLSSLIYNSEYNFFRDRFGYLSTEPV